jgi:hypothetical protein
VTSNKIVFFVSFQKHFDGQGVFSSTMTLLIFLIRVLYGGNSRSSASRRSALSNPRRTFPRIQATRP